MVVIAAAGCRDQAPVVATKLVLAAAPNATVQNRVAFATQPRVQLTDNEGRAAHTSGVVVTAAVTTPGATIAGVATATTNDAGLAVFTDLSIAGTMGNHQIEFSAPALSPVTASVLSRAGLPATVAAFSGNNQSALIASPVTVSPVARVTDADGNPVADVVVTFAVTAGGGSVIGATATTNFNGLAVLTRWTLGNAAGTNNLSATAAGATPATFTATAVGSDFDIELVFQTSVTTSQRAAFESSVARWRRIITHDIGDVNVQTAANGCTPAINAVINDVRIYVTLEAIDGPGKVLGSAGPCFIQSESKLPIVGAMRFDTADLASLENNGRLEDVILHEMGHVLGVGSLWNTKSLLVGGGGSDPFFTGSEAIARFNSVGGTAYTGSKVPVENTGGGGTADSHWRESVFNNELMTGFINNGPNPLSVITIGSLQDLGYTVNIGEAQTYSWSASSALRAPESKIQMLNDVLPFVPVAVVSGKPAPAPQPRR